MKAEAVLMGTGGNTHDIAQAARAAAKEAKPISDIRGSKSYRREMVDTNYEVGKRYFSYSVLRRKLRHLITNVRGL